MFQIYIKSQFEGFHRWKDAPDEVAFLRDFHRHIFHVTVQIAVNHTNRDIEFFKFKKLVDKYIQLHYAGKSFEYSCEHIALDISRMFRAESVTVSEDGENGAIVTASKNPSETVADVPFYGVEVEGPDKGSDVLFVPAGRQKHLVTPAMLEQIKPSRIYYGAGNARGSCSLNEYEEGLKACISYAQQVGPACVVDIEFEAADIQIIKEALRSCEVQENDLGHLIAYHRRHNNTTYKASDELNCVYKYVNEVTQDIVWKMPNCVEYVTWLRDPGFDSDCSIETLT